MSSRLETPPEATTGFGRAGGDLAQQFEVRALQGAVLRDVGDDVAAAAGLFEPVEHRPEVAALLGPAARGERRAAHVEPDGDHVAVPADDVGRPLGVLQRRGAEVDARGAALERGLERCVVADAARELDLHARAPA